VPPDQARSGAKADPLTETAAGVELLVRVIPRARKTAFGGMRDDAIVVRISSPPVEGAANEALIAFLAEVLHVPRRSVRILSGDRGRQKRIAIAGVTADQVRVSLAESGEP
jgi:uncharacterized protein (TIGR00251 family)